MAILIDQTIRIECSSDESEAVLRMLLNHSKRVNELIRLPSVELATRLASLIDAESKTRHMECRDIAPWIDLDPWWHGVKMGNVHCMRRGWPLRKGGVYLRNPQAIIVYETMVRLPKDLPPNKVYKVLTEGTLAFLKEVAQWVSSTT